MDGGMDPLLWEAGKKTPFGVEPKVYDGAKWTAIKPGDDGSNNDGKIRSKTAGIKKRIPPHPVVRGDGTIFISIASFRDGQRCGETIRSIFQNAKYPEKITIGLSEQNAAEDIFCVEQYCKMFGVSSVERSKIRQDMVKVQVVQKRKMECPRFQQIRQLSIHDIGAKGPMMARSLARKVLGNEEFCMQIDAHSVFVKDWDELVRKEWYMTRNEFAILSNIPAAVSERANFEENGGSKLGQVPRQCVIKFRDNGVPNYQGADGFAVGLKQPLLGHTWSAAFSFAKCHLEESAPYDPFAHYAPKVEEFSRYARFWTRGYDVYTPTRNIIYHYFANPPHPFEWMNPKWQRFREAAAHRMKTLLQLQGGDVSATAHANLGIYGLGKRRNLQQLEQFLNMDFSKKLGNTIENDRFQCAEFEWVPYDTSISPTTNLHDKSVNLDPQPEYPLRTKLVYYQQQYKNEPGAGVGEQHQGDNRRDSSFQYNHKDGTLSEIAPGWLIFAFWVFGIFAWRHTFMVKKKERSGRATDDDERKQPLIMKKTPGKQI